jgi:TfoX/Sxy family transcriptional regulator of competence genes
MAYDAELEARIDQLTAEWDVPLTKKKMFGGLGYMSYGNMCFGIHKDELIIRANEQKAAELLKRPGIHEFSMGHSRTSKTWVMASKELIADKNELANLLTISSEYVSTLPPKDK